MPNFPDSPIDRKISPISVADARKQLQEALDREDQVFFGEDLDAVRRRAIAENTGTSNYLPPVLAPTQLPQPSWTPPAKESPASGLPHPEVSE